MSNLKKHFISGIAILIFVFTVASCKQKLQEIEISSDDYHSAVDKLTSIMIHDVFSPPVASRIYSYPNIAAHEALNNGVDSGTSLSGKLNQLTLNKKAVSGNTNIKLASLIAYIDVAKELIFSKDQMVNYRDSLYKNWENKNAETFKESKEYGLFYSNQVISWMNKDNYSETRTFPEYNVSTEDPSKWKATPPAYMDAIEPHWNKIRPFVLDSASQFKPQSPPKFSLEKGSDFYKELIDVYNISKEIERKGDDSEEIAIARFWDCNPYVSVTKGHFMFAEKKITPGAHWIGICKIACKETNSNYSETVSAYTKTSIAIADAFISCWDEKYRSNLIRPETLINKHLDDSWEPVLQTPPFPEYTSGHSVVSGAASTVLTSIFGDNFSFVDITEIPFGLPSRSFTSFNKAADEAAMSRLYGGIHYISAITIGLKQGREIGNFHLKKSH